MVLILVHLYLYSQLSKIHQSEAKTLKFYKPSGHLDTNALQRRNPRPSHSLVFIGGKLCGKKT